MKHDNPPAFPIPDTTYPNGQVQYGSNGMTLRDYFAAKAIPELMREWSEDHDEIASEAYKIADAMLAARATPPTGGDAE